MAARDGTGPKVSRSVTSCADCLAWGPTYAQGVCLACYNFAAARFGHHEGVCRTCRRRVRLKKGYCRLCWCQAREDRAVTATDARSQVVLAPFLARVRHHQLFLADLYRPRARPRTAPRRYGEKGRPLKPPPRPAGRPAAIGAQLPLISDLPRTYRPGSVDLRADAPPDNPWLAWALHVASSTAEARGFDPMVRQALNRNLVMPLATHAEGDLVRASEFHHVIRRHGGALVHVLDVLTEMGILLDDRPSVFDTWLEAKLTELAPAIAVQAERWARVLRDGSPRRRPRQPETAMAYLNAARPALLDWSQTFSHLREISREDVTGYLAPLHGAPRHTALVALRSLFAWAKREGTMFRNPTTGIRHPRRARPIWQRLTDDELRDAIAAANTPQARVFLALAAVHAARPGQIRALRLDDIDLANRQIRIAGRTRPLDEMTHQVLTEWLAHRRDHWPHTANTHLLISKESALRLGPVSAPFILNLRGLPATLDRLRIDRQLEEALATGADPLHLAAMFDISSDTAIRYAANARHLLADDHTGDHAATPSGALPTRASNPENRSNKHSGSA